MEDFIFCKENKKVNVFVTKRKAPWCGELGETEVLYIFIVYP